MLSIFQPNASPILKTKKLFSYADIQNMQIISYVQYGDTENKKKREKEHTGKNGDFPLRSNFAYNVALPFEEKNNKVIKAPLVTNFVLALLSICMIGVAGFLIYFSLGLKTKIRSFELYTLSDSQSALQEYLFPRVEENISASKLLADSGDFLTEVSFKTYTIQAGDTISGVAYKFGLHSIGTLIALNDISNVKRLKVGDTLKIPSMDGVFHKVRRGETLAEIAQRYGLTLNNLVDANDLKSEIINVGDTVFIPGGTLSSFELKKALGELFIYPVQGRLTSPFGYRRDPFTGLRSFHSGIDLANRMGTPVKCIMDGRVSEVGYSSVFGNYIIVVHDGGYQSLYGHLSRVYVKRGSLVSQGSRIAAIGSTGRSTGPHLHLSIYKNGKLINPLSVLQN